VWFFFDEGCKKSDALPEVLADVEFTKNISGYAKLSRILRKQKLVPRMARVSMVAVFVDEWAVDHATCLGGCSRYRLEVIPARCKIRP
jgi:hypothetical protein